MDMSVSWILWSRGIRVQFHQRDHKIRFSTPPTTESKPIKEGVDSTPHTCPTGHLIITAMVNLITPH